MHLTHTPETQQMFWNVQLDQWMPLSVWQTHDSSLYPLFIVRPRGYPDHLCLGVSTLIRQLYRDGEAPEEYWVGEQPDGTGRDGDDDHW